MTRFFIEDTPEGYRFGIVSSTMKAWVESEGGHDELEKLYAVVAETWTKLRAEALAEHAFEREEGR